MTVYKKILLATDFSDSNRVALERAEKLAKLNNCELIVLNVIEHFPVDGGPLSSVFQFNPEPSNAVAEHVRARMTAFVDSLEYENVQQEFRMTSKSARHEILRFADAHKADLIVVARHGQGIIGALGSTATGVLNHAQCDVLAVRDE